MIQLTRLNNHPILLNSDLIKWIEDTPDTVLTLVSGEKVLVAESSGEVLEKIIEFRRQIFPALTPGGYSAASGNAPEALISLHPERR